MEINFDIRGHLKPYGKNVLSQEEFKAGFIDSFFGSKKRRILFEGLLKYNLDLKKVVGESYIQWINGSFISTRENPNDIDLVNIIDYQLISNQERELKQFLNPKSRKQYGVDAYIIRIYPKEHRYHVRTKSDLIYWNNWFSNGKINRRRLRYPKGFVEIVI